MAYFPFMIDITGKRILIVGGGRSAAWKVRAFEGFGAEVTVIAPEIAEEIEQNEHIRKIRRLFAESDFSDADMLVAATDDREQNRRIATRARELGIPVNAVDDKEMCDYIFPAIIRRDNYTVAVCTDGKSPLLAREIKKSIAGTLPDSFDRAVGELGAVREKVKKQADTPDERQRIFTSIAEKYIGRRKLRIGTRGSELAMIQTQMVMDALQATGIESEAVVVKTMGDKVQDKPLWKFGGKSVFVTEFEDAILSGRIDLAIHSAKDMPAECPPGTAILACLPRGDVRDVLVSRKALSEGKIRRVGTSSLRRKVQIERLHPEYRCESIRGNVPTRLHKLRIGEYDAVVLAAAGLHRLQLDAEPDLRYSYLEPGVFIPAAGQAVIAVEGPRGGGLRRMLEPVNDEKAARELAAERRFMRAIGAGCHEAVGAFAELMPDGSLRMDVMKDYGGALSVHRAGSWTGAPEALADLLAGQVLMDDPARTADR